MFFSVSIKQKPFTNKYCSCYNQPFCSERTLIGVLHLHFLDVIFTALKINWLNVILVWNAPCCRFHLQTFKRACKQWKLIASILHYMKTNGCRLHAKCDATWFLRRLPSNSEYYLRWWIFRHDQILNTDKSCLITTHYVLFRAYNKFEMVQTGVL